MKTFSEKRKNALLAIAKANTDILESDTDSESTIEIILVHNDFVQMFDLFCDKAQARIHTESFKTEIEREMFATLFFDYEQPSKLGWAI